MYRVPVMEETKSVCAALAGACSCASLNDGGPLPAKITGSNTPISQQRCTAAAEKRSTSKPWKKAAPKKSRHPKLTPATKAKAKASAKKAGRLYPNLVDNMKAAAKQRSGSTKRSATAKIAKKGGARKGGE